MIASLSRPIVVWHTLRHLRLRQLAGQLRFRLRRKLRDPRRFASRTTPRRPRVRWCPRTDFLAPGGAAADPRELLEGRFRFLNRTVDLGWPPDWDATAERKLWQYNVHYFEWLWAVDFEAARHAVLDWIRRHPLERGRVGWEAYPVSLRLLNWIALFWGRFRSATERDRPFADELWHSVYLQAEWLRTNLETHLLGNHLLENAAALTFAGSCFDGEAAQRWYAAGERLLVDELAEQILPDGMHYERSPMYHLRATYVALLLFAAAPPPLADRIERTLRRMLAAIPLLCHPDGRIALLNDSAFGVHNEPSSLLGWGAELLGEPVPQNDGPFALRDAGYYGFRDGQDYLICDAGPLGPDYQPAHGHGDLLGFELSLNGARVIVDSGVYDYEPSELRRWCRSTRSHNTVEIAGRDQSEFWAVFRVGRRARPRSVAWRPSPAGFELAAAHDGYRRLPGAPLHQRRFSWRAGPRLEIHDEVTAGRAVRSISRLHLHPDCRIDSLGEATGEIVFPGGRLVVRWSSPDVQVRTEPSIYCPEFGIAIDSSALAFESRGESFELRLCFEPG